MTRNRTEVLDNAGAIVSFACAIHCLVMPLLLGILAAYGATRLATPAVEWLVLGVSSVLGLTSLVPAYRARHQRRCCLAMFLAGVAAIVAAHVLLEDSHRAETAAVCMGAVLICSAHISNRILCRRCKTCESHEQVR